MKVHLLQNTKRARGFALQFQYSKLDVENAKNCLGLTWDKAQMAWVSDGPEVLLDMQRFGIGVGFIAKDAKENAENFRQELWDVIDAKREPIHETAFGYQSQGSKVLAASSRYLLCDEMGLGKSKQALDAAVEIGAERVLIVAPKTLTYNWVNEIQKWHPELTTAVVPDERKTSKKRMGRDDFWEKPLANFTIVNYEKTFLIDWPYDIRWDVVIFDEASRLKNSTTATWKAMKKILLKTDYAWGLTGTPLEIRLEELYSIFTLLRPAVLGNYMRFRNAHCIIDWAGTVVGSQNLELLRDRIGYWMLRRTKAEVLPELPPKLFNNYFIQLNQIEKREYQELLMDFDKFLHDHDMGGSGDPLVQMLRMRQFCCAPALVGVERRGGSKYEALLENIKDWNGNGILVFCFFEEMTNLLRQWLQEDLGSLYNPEAYISGKINVEERFKLIERFNAGQLGKVFISTDAGQFGLNITGADLVVHYDQLWNPQKMHQREDRTHRIGQQGVVNVMNLLCVDTIDYGMYQLNLERQQLFDDVIEGAEEAMLKKLSAARLRKIAEGKLNETARIRD